MAKVNVRNRNEGKFYKDGKKKPANWEYRFEAAKVDGKRNTISKAGFATKRMLKLLVQGHCLNMIMLEVISHHLKSHILIISIIGSITM